MPRYTREQIYRRRRIVALVILLLLISLIFYLISLVVSFFTGPGEANQTAPAQGAEAGVPIGRNWKPANPNAMVVRDNPPGSAIRQQLPRGIKLAAGEVLGIDVSNHQEEINWQRVADAGVTYAYLKATEGVGFTDAHFADNWEQARKHGVTVGAYHYFTLCSPGVDQARFFLETVPVVEDSLPPVVDLEFDGACSERPPGEKVNAEVDTFVRLVERAWGRRIVVYTSQPWRNAYGTPAEVERPQWYYANNRPEGEHAIWQVTFKARVPGIAGNVDLDIMRPAVLRRQMQLSAR
ncbi:glycoside hydrolase family 25 protein [Dermabacteraceae bacterium P9123]